MKTNPNPSDEPTELRRHAEARLSERPKAQRAKTCVGSSSEADTARQLHELEVHQIELEMQNAELAEARDRMEALLEKYTDLYDFAPVGYLTLDHEGTIREANLTGASLLGVVRSALVKRRFGHFVAPSDRPVFEAFFQSVLASRVRQSCEVALEVEGRPPLSVLMEAIAFESEESCRVTVTDITERKRAEADRLILNKLESTGILAGGIAHDFNNLLTVILLHTELAQKLTPRGDELEHHLEQAKLSTLLAQGLTAQLITFANGGAPVRTVVVLSAVIREAIRPALSGSSVRCKFSLAENLWATEVDAVQMGQVIRNLILNAREAMLHGGVIFVRAENVVLSAHEQPSLPAGEYVRVSIADQGAGMAKDVLPKIFDPYFSTKQRGPQKGMGLGLTICHAIVQKHGGAMAVESTVGVGTTFHIHLPATRKVCAREQAVVPVGAARLGKVLVMEDEEPVRKVLGLALWGLGHGAELTESGEMAIEAFKKAKSLGRPFDVVMLDLTVREGMGGRETLLALLKIDSAVNAIAMSGYTHDPVILDPERHGFAAALAKPFNVVQLREILSRIVGPESNGLGPVTSDQ